ncbi:MAG: hypothetical protein HYZ65_11935 [Burkholderiales bacterium]|nr:hypothetical protein [Burkholderiales bacterium]
MMDLPGLASPFMMRAFAPDGNVYPRRRSGKGVRWLKCHAYLPRIAYTETVTA